MKKHPVEVSAGLMLGQGLSCAPGETLNHLYWCSLTHLVSPKTSQYTDSKWDWNLCESLSFPQSVSGELGHAGVWVETYSPKPVLPTSRINVSNPGSEAQGWGHTPGQQKRLDPASSTWPFWENGSGMKLQGPRTKSVYGWSTSRSSCFAEDSDKGIYNLIVLMKLQIPWCPAEVNPTFGKKTLCRSIS